MSTTSGQAVAVYLRRIRNQAKRQYGYAAWHAIVNGQEMPGTPGNLSYMGAQAVRLELEHFNPATGQRKAEAAAYVPWPDRPGHDAMHCWAHTSCIAVANARVRA